MAVTYFGVDHWFWTGGIIDVMTGFRGPVISAVLLPKILVLHYGGGPAREQAATGEGILGTKNGRSQYPA